MKVAVLTDSTSDIHGEMETRLGVTVVPLYVNFQNQVRKDYLEIKTGDIFNGVKNGAAMPSTSQPTPADFQREYERLLQTHDHVLSVHLSSKLSGTYASAELASREFPGKVTVFDSEVASGSLAMMVERATRLLQSGSSLSDVVGTLERVRKLTDLRFSVASLDFLKKNGRIGGAQALIGGLLGIKPILHLREGRVEAAGRERGPRAALENCIKNLREYKAKHGDVRATYIYTDKLEDADALRQAGKDLGVHEFAVLQAGAVIASHVGPGTYGVLAEPVKV
ncbi:MAG: DegV family protein [Pleurocapsa sp. SU_196_0]|nr:DegV family protein [Pleurocapsa sp. SU_196_0]